MRPVVRTLLVSLRDLVIVLGVLVWLARSDQMPQVVPPQLTDFLVDLTDQIFGKTGGGAAAAATDLADLAMYGETDRESRQSLDLYRVRLENWFARVLDNVEGIVSHPLVRKSLPDFGQNLSLLFVADYLGGMVEQYQDMDEIMILGNDGVLVRKTREGIKPFSPEEVHKDLMTKARTDYSPVLRVPPGPRFLLLASFLSPMRERQGYVAVILNDTTIKKMISEYAGGADTRLYLKVSLHDPAIESGKGSSWEKNGTQPLASALRHERFIKTSQGQRRNLAVALRIGESETGMTLGVLAPLADPDRLILLGLRFLLLVMTVIVCVWLVRRFIAGLRRLARTHGLRERLLMHTLDASRKQGTRMLEKVRRVGQSRRPIRRELRRESPPRITNENNKKQIVEEVLSDFIPSHEPDAAKFSRLHFDASQLVKEGEFVLIDGQVDMTSDREQMDLPDIEPMAPAPIDD